MGDHVAGFLGRIERMFEEVVEGSSRRLFRARLQPIQLAKAASRAMQQQQLIGPDGPEVPNEYRIILHPTDYDAFASYKQSLRTKIQRYLDGFAADRGLRPVADLSVELVSDESVRAGSIVVDARMADIDQEPGQPTAGEPFPRAPAPLDAQHASGTPTLVAEDGRRFTVDGHLTSLGRALDNDVVIADSRVSRHHAEIRRVGAGYSVRDLGSTNGTAVAGKRISERPLGEGDEISLGGFKIVIRFSDV